MRPLVVIYVLAPAVLMTAYWATGATQLYLAGLIAAFPLSFFVYPLVFYVLVLALPLDSNAGLPILGVALTGAAMLQALTFGCTIRRLRSPQT
jgi:hypothetical protein